MPYIEPHRREDFDRNGLPGVERELSLGAKPGDLAYVVYRLLIAYTRRVDSFSSWAAARGAIEDAVDEFRKRFVEDYEADKRAQNGDVQ